MKILSPSLLSADFLNLGRDIEMLNRSDAEWLHLDIMDGHFVPNISYGFPLLKAIRSATDKFLDVHLMISEPARYIDRFIEEGANNITIHIENNSNVFATLQHIREAGVMAGVAVNPQTPISALEEIVHVADVVMFMSVNPGFGGQFFIDSTMDKIRGLRGMLDRQNLPTMIGVDGGINCQNAANVFAAGADIVVAGNAVFNSDDPEVTIKHILGKL